MDVLDELPGSDVTNMAGKCPDVLFNTSSFTWMIDDCHVCDLQKKHNADIFPPDLKLHTSF